MNHVVLLGDSIFDNAAYVSTSEPDVVTQLHQQLPGRDKATLLAVDGHLTRHVPGQLENLPDDATHLVLSVGGNDGLGYLQELEGKLSSGKNADEFLETLQDVRDRFARDYRQTIQATINRDLPTCLFTIYSGDFENHGDPETQQIVDTVLPILNDVILDAAMTYQLPVVHLERLFNNPSDYANPIEPSAQGGQKIATTIVELIEENLFNPNHTILID